METPDRLAAYLAGELPETEASALERELARDPALRAQLAAIRRADEALTQLDPPIPPPGFEARLREHLEPVVAEELTAADAAATAELPATGTASGTGPEGPDQPVDELAVRRQARRSGGMRWLPAAAGAAAAVAAVVVVAGNLDLGGTEDAQTMMDTDDAPESFDADVAEDEPQDEAQDEMLADDDAAAPAPPDGPTVAAADRELDETAIEDVLVAPELQDVAAQAYTSTSATETARSWNRALGLAPDEDTPDTEADDADGAEEAAPRRSTGEVLTEEDEQDLARCLEEVHAGDPAANAIPAYVEFAAYDGDEVLVFGFVTEDPDSGTFTRTEAWVVERTDCDVRYFTQR